MDQLWDFSCTWLRRVGETPNAPSDDEAEAFSGWRSGSLPLSTGNSATAKHTWRGGERGTVHFVSAEEGLRDLD